MHYWVGVGGGEEEKEYPFIFTSEQERGGEG